MNMRVVPYEPKYVQAVQAVCLETAGAAGNSKKEAFTLAMYCDGYLKHGTAYVLLDDDQRVQGYILCAPDWNVYQTQLQESTAAMGFFQKLMARGEAAGYAAFAKDYPAHLHIDIRESCTGKGGGSMLMNALITELRQRKIPGIMLQVSTKNTRAIAFYQKHGFEVLKTSKMALTMGRKS